MTIPTYEQMMLPMLKLIESGHETIQSCEADLIAEFGISPEDMNIMLPSGKQSRFRNRAHWARTYLAQAGLVTPIKRGHFTLTDRGKTVLKSNPATIDNKFLAQFPEFVEFKGKSSKSADGEATSTGSESLQSAEETPEDLIASASEEIEAALADQLLAAIQTVTPTRFEQIIVDLLLAMGYGGGDRSMGERLGKTGDGGIDGIINEDKLGLDAVYIQAKRYAPGNTVGRPTLQAFVGSLTGEGATKGVFVTTSDFSKDARDYLNKVQHRIVLINGDRLARLLIQHDVGVRPRKTYVIRSIDEDYFSED